MESILELSLDISSLIIEQHQKKPSSQTKQTMFEIHNSVVANVTDALLFILKCHLYRGNSPSLFGNIIRIRIEQKVALKSNKGCHPSQLFLLSLFVSISCKFVFCWPWKQSKYFTVNRIRGFRQLMSLFHALLQIGFLMHLT